MHESNAATTTIPAPARDVLEFPPTLSREENGRASLALATEASRMADAPAANP